MATLAIKGHATRGSEVIGLLEMLGGVNIHNHTGDMDYDYYKIVGSNIVVAPNQNEKCILFTLEQFLEKFPYKVGDKVKTIYGKIGNISKPIWVSKENCVRYELEADVDSFYYANELQPYIETKEETMNIEKRMKGFADKACQFNDEVTEFSIDLGNIWKAVDDKGCIIDADKITFRRKQPQYPKTYVECAKILDCFSAAHIDGYKCELLEKLQELIVCRDAYWKIAGEQMGLGKPWELDWGDKCQEKWFITTFNNTISCDFCNNHSYVIAKHNHILAFPTEEMRDAFYENFKEPIEEVKELL